MLKARRFSNYSDERALTLAKVELEQKKLNTAQGGAGRAGQAPLLRMTVMTPSSTRRYSTWTPRMSFGIICRRTSNRNRKGRSSCRKGRRMDVMRGGDADGDAAQGSKGKA